MKRARTELAPRPADYWRPLSGGRVECRLCPHGCRLGEGQRGLCHSRTNRGGRLWADSYGKVCALQVDPVEKKPLFHFYPASHCFSLSTTGCNLSCRNCQNWTLSQAAPEETDYVFLQPADVARLAAESGCPLVAYTYAEPLTYFEYTRDCARACCSNGLKNVLVTAGYVNEEPLSELLPYIAAANVDLKSFSDATYHAVSRARLSPVLRTLEQICAAGVWVEVTNLLIPGVNDDDAMIRAMCRWLVAHGYADRPLHFSRFFPQFRLNDRPPTPVATLLRARDIARECGLRYVYLGNLRLAGAADTVCPACGAVLIRRAGYSVLADGFRGLCPHCGASVAGCF